LLNRVKTLKLFEKKEYAKREHIIENGVERLKQMKRFIKKNGAEKSAP